VITGVIEETSDTKSFVLEIPGFLTDTFSYLAGQYCTFRASVAGDIVVRSYSMSSCPELREPLTVTVKRVTDGIMSNYMIDELVEGQSIEVMRPAGKFLLQPRSVPIVAFAGGSGITPVISVIKSALVSTDRSILLVYANRDPESVIFRDALESLCSRFDDRLHVYHHLDSESGFLGPDDCVALVDGRADADFYVCGPGPYMQTVETGLEQVGIRPSQLFIERFVLPEDASILTESSATESLTIRLGRRKHTAEYHSGETLLEAARRAGLSPPSSCEAGNCATCMAHLDEGVVAMRVNNALTPAEVEEGWILTCQSIPQSRTVVVNYDT
jgi:ferredoxin-NADP reductase